MARRFRADARRVRVGHRSALAFLECQHEISEDNSVQWTRGPENGTHSCPLDSIAEETLELVPCAYILLDEQME